MDRDFSFFTVKRSHVPKAQLLQGIDQPVDDFDVAIPEDGSEPLLQVNLKGKTEGQGKRSIIPAESPGTCL